MKDKKVVIGVDLGGTKISAAVFEQDGHMVQKEVRPLAHRKGKEVMALLAELILQLKDKANSSSLKLLAVGICVPGIYDPRSKRAWAPNIPGWENYPIRDELKLFLGDPSISIVIESDRSCYILGEVWKGSALNCSDAIFLAVGTGIGAGILSGGNIISGFGGIAGAIGWMALEPPYDRKYDSWGNFEHYASGDGIARSAMEVLGENKGNASLLDPIPGDEMTAQHVFHAIEKGDQAARQVIDKAIMYWGMAVANLVSTFNPEKVIFGGGVFGPALKYLDEIREEAEKWAQPLAIRKVSLEASALEGDAGLIGSGYLAIKSMHENPDDGEEI